MKPDMIRLFLNAGGKFGMLRNTCTKFSKVGTKMNFGGMGRTMLTTMMKEKEVASVEDLFAMAREMGVKQIACTMSMDVMGITKEDLIDGIDLGGVATFLGDAARSKVSLFI